MILLVLSLHMSQPKTVTVDVLAKAVSQVESNDNDFKVGRNGERSRYQIQKYVWESVEKSKAFEIYASDRTIAFNVFVRHVVWIQQRLINFNDGHSRIWQIAYAYHAGVHALKENFGGNEAVDYANRVEALYEKFNAGT